MEKVQLTFDKSCSTRYLFVSMAPKAIHAVTLTNARTLYMDTSDAGSTSIGDLKNLQKANKHSLLLKKR